MQLESEIHSIMARCVDEGKAVGIVAGILDEEGPRCLSFGKTGLDKPDQTNRDTIFELASITKVFTSLLLAALVQQEKIRLNDPVAKFLPAHVRLPERHGRRITLLDLSMHVSGLPRMPSNFQTAAYREENPYAHYDAPLLYDFLSNYELTRDIGSLYEYSNLGYGLLGHALALYLGQDYEQALQEHVFRPLGMAGTAVALPEMMGPRLARGHNEKLQPVMNWDMGVFMGAGGIRSSVHDMLIFLAANLECAMTPVQQALQTMRSCRRPSSIQGTDIAMGWHISRKGDQEIVWHNGGTGGYRSFTGFDPVKKKAVVLLCNTWFDVDDIGFRILRM